jgi:hypothetical protein
MYQADIEFGMKQHPWRKVLDQCFVTRRDVYEECGGLREELGHFAEWVLAAAYHARGYTIGYLEEARFHHYYVGQIDELKTFTLDFVQGEIRYLSEGRRDPGSELLEIPREWSEPDDVDRPLALHAMNALMRYSLAGRGWMRPHETLRTLWRWAAPVLFGNLSARAAACIGVVHARAVLTVLTVAGSSDALARWLKRYIASLIRLQRIECIRRLGGPTRPAPKLLGDHVIAQIGFHAVETYAGHTFRWSEPQAAVRIKSAPGRSTICIQSPALRAPLDKIGTQFYLNDARVDPAAVEIGRDHYTLSVDLPPSGVATLAWACPVLRGAGDVRRLGLSVVAIDVHQESSAGDQKNSGLAAAI